MQGRARQVQTYPPRSTEGPGRASHRARGLPRRGVSACAQCLEPELLTREVLAHGLGEGGAGGSWLWLRQAGGHRGYRAPVFFHIFTARWQSWA